MRYFCTGETKQDEKYWACSTHGRRERTASKLRWKTVRNAWAFMRVKYYTRLEILILDGEGIAVYAYVQGG
jgi:hypothetical protein